MTISNRSVPPHATISALPPSVSNHVMRSKNAREKDASNRPVPIRRATSVPLGKGT